MSKLLDNVQIFHLLTDLYMYLIYQLFRDVLRSTNVIVVLPIFPLSFIEFCYIYFEALLLDANTFSTGISS